MIDLSASLAKLHEEAVARLYAQAEGKTEIICGLCHKPFLVAETRPKLISPRTIQEALEKLTLGGEYNIEMALCCLECCRVK